MGSQLGFPLCRCRYEQEMNHDGPSSVWSSSPTPREFLRLVSKKKQAPSAPCYHYALAGSVHRAETWIQPMFRICSHSWARCYCGGSENIFSVHLLCIRPYLFTFGKMYKISSHGESKTREQREQFGIKKNIYMTCIKKQCERQEETIKHRVNYDQIFSFSCWSCGFDLKSPASYPFAFIFHPGL